MRGSLFDQSTVLEDAQQLLDGLGVLDRCEIVAGSFFDEDAIPPAADLYMVRVHVCV